jgi:N-acetylglucosamine-6-phosphate deacetylase
MNRIKLHNAHIITPLRQFENGFVLVEDGLISAVGEGDLQVEDCLSIDVKGKWLTPGFIDIHTHGGGGHDFMDGTVEAYLGAVETHARHGTTSIVPTTLTSTMEELRNAFDVFGTAKAANRKGARMLGLHLEGPYFAMSQKGAQDPRYIRDPKPEEYLEILGWSDDIIRWSAAPELPGALAFGRELAARGILASIAHSDAVCEQVVEAFENGFTHFTHLYSAMSGVRRINAYRYAGVIESAFLLDEATVEIIADGVHLPASLLKLICKIKGPGRTALVTDSMRAAGMPEGESIIGSLRDGMKVIVEDGVAKLPDRSVFAGSVATADRLVRTMRSLAGIPLMEAVRMMTSTPAAILGLGRRTGCIAPGMDADMVVFDDDVSIVMTLIGGRIVYEKG